SISNYYTPDLDSNLCYNFSINMRNSDTLFTKFLNYKKCSSINSFQQFEKENIIYLSKDEIIDEAIYKFSHLQKSGFGTFYVGLSFWNINSDYFAESRKAATRLKDFIRVYIFKDIIDLDNKYTQLLIKKDIESRTKVYICRYDDIPKVEIKKDFGI